MKKLRNTLNIRNDYGMAHFLLAMAEQVIEACKKQKGSTIDREGLVKWIPLHI